MASGAHAHEPLRGVELFAENGEHVHAGKRLALQKNGDVIARDLQAGGLFESDGVGLMRRLLQHRGETKEFAVSWLVDDHLLVILIDGRDPHASGNHDVSLSGGVAYFVNPLAWSET